MILFLISDLIRIKYNLIKLNYLTWISVGYCRGYLKREISQTLVMGEKKRERKGAKQYEGCITQPVLAHLHLL